MTIHNQFNAGRKEGEFTINEFAQAVGITYDSAKRELQEACTVGVVARRRIGTRSYYSMI
jgi:predicted transcriptional regulator